MNLARMLLAGKMLALWCSLAGGAELRGVVVRIRNSEGGSSSLGSGTVIALEDGTPAVLSCAHLFRDGVGRLSVTLPDGETHPARLIRRDRQNDLSLLAVDGPLPEPIMVAESEPARGQTAWAAGYGGEGRYRQYGGSVYGYRGGNLCVDGAARSGDSGGPIFNDRGELCAVLWGTDGWQTYATPAKPIRRMLSGVTETQCYGGQCGPQGGSGSVGIGVGVGVWRQRPPANYAAPQPRRPSSPLQAPPSNSPPATAETRPPSIASPPCRSCECDAPALAAQIAALKIELAQLNTAIAAVQSRPEPLKADDFAAVLSKHPIRAQIVSPSGGVLSESKTYLGGEPLKFQLRPREVVKK